MTGAVLGRRRVNSIWRKRKMRISRESLSYHSEQTSSSIDCRLTQKIKASIYLKHRNKRSRRIIRNTHMRQRSQRVTGDEMNMKRVRMRNLYGTIIMKVMRKAMKWMVKMTWI